MDAPSRDRPYRRHRAPSLGGQLHEPQFDGRQLGQTDASHGRHLEPHQKFALLGRVLVAELEDHLACGDLLSWQVGVAAKRDRLQAMRMLEAGVPAAESIRTATEPGCKHPARPAAHHRHRGSTYAWRSPSISPESRR